jgi:hypothetical protein
MFRAFQFTMTAAILLVGSEAMAWSTSPIPGTAAAGHSAQGYAWKYWGSGVWDKWHSVAYGHTGGDVVKVARRQANNGSPAWSNWVIETVDDTVNLLQGLSITVGKQDGTEFIAYVDVDTTTLKVARRVGGTAGNCGFLSQWDCETVTTVDAALTPSIEVRYDSVIQDYVIYVVYTTESSAGVRNLKYARKSGTNPWSIGTIKANTNKIRLASDAIALDGTTPHVAFAETSVGVQVSQFTGPSLSTWTTTLIDANGGGYPSMDIRSTRREIAYTNNTDLKSASWSSSSATWTVSTVDTSVQGTYLSLVIDDTFNPQIAYRKGDAPWLAKLGTSGWSTTGTVTPTAAGISPSLQLDTQPGTDKAILVHVNSSRVLHATDE